MPLEPYAVNAVTTILQITQEAPSGDVCLPYWAWIGIGAGVGLGYTALFAYTKTLTRYVRADSQKKDAVIDDLLAELRRIRRENASV